MSWKDQIPHHQLERDPSKADVYSPALLGIPTTPTPVIGLRSQQIANAEFVIDTVNNSGALLTSGNQEWVGIKTAINVGAGIRAGFKFVNNQTSGVGAMVDIDNNGAFGQIIYSTRGVGLSITSLGARGIQLSALTGEALYSSSRAGANNVVLHNIDGFGSNVTASQGPLANGLNFVGQNSGITTFSVDKYGDIVARNITAVAGVLPAHVVIKSQLDTKANIISPIFSGIPQAPTASPGTATEQIATTAFVTNASKVEQSVIQGSALAVSGGAVYAELLLKQDFLGYTPENVGNKDQALGYVGLDANQKINPLFLPATILADVRPVASEAAMLALPSVVGTVAIRSDISKTFILQAGPASTLSNWLELLSPTQGVQSVFGRVGPVTAQNGDYSTTLVTEGVRLYYTEARVDANINVAANTAARHAALTLSAGNTNGLVLNVGTQVLSMARASATVTGALSSADWAIFNAKQAALINPITGVVVPGNLVKAETTGQITASSITEDVAGNIGMTSLYTKNPAELFSIFSSGSDSSRGIALGTDLSGVPLIQGTNADKTDYINIAMQTLGGVVLIGTNMASSDSILEVAGTISAFAGQEPGEVVVKEQLDTKLDKELSTLASIELPLTGAERVVIEQEGEARLLDLDIFTTGGGSGRETTNVVVDKTLSELALAVTATDTEIEQAFEELLLSLPTTVIVDGVMYNAIYIFRLIEL
jgi:hypothetical protein